MNTNTTTTSAGVADESKVMVKLVSVLPQYEVPADDIAVPSEIRRKGLSKVVNYLLGNEDSDDDSDNDIDNDGGLASPSSKVSFDFMVKNKFLQQSVAGYIRSASLSFESVLTIHFLPRSTKPSDSSPSDTLPDWVSSVAHGGPMLAVGCYDGVVRVFDPKGMGVVASASAHQAAVKAVAVCADKSLVASGGHDQALKLHSYDAEAKALTTASECGGHSASVEALSFSPSGLLASGDFAGGVCIYEVGDAAGGAVGGEAAGSKKRKVSGSGSEAGGETVKVGYIRIIIASITVSNNHYNHLTQASLPSHRSTPPPCTRRLSPESPGPPTLSLSTQPPMTQPSASSTSPPRTPSSP